MGDNQESSGYNYLTLSGNATLDDLKGDINNLVNAYLENSDDIPNVAGGISFSSNLLLYTKNNLLNFDTVISGEQTETHSGKEWIVNGTSNGSSYYLKYNGRNNIIKIQTGTLGQHATNIPTTSSQKLVTASGTQHRPYMDWWEITYGESWPGGSYNENRAHEWKDHMNEQQYYGANGGLTPKGSDTNTWNNRTKSRWYIPNSIDPLDANILYQGKRWPFLDWSLAKPYTNNQSVIRWGKDSSGKYQGWRWDLEQYSTFSPTPYNVLDPDNEYADDFDELTIRKINKAVGAQKAQIDAGITNSSEYETYITDQNLYFLLDNFSGLIPGYEDMGDTDRTLKVQVLNGDITYYTSWAYVLIGGPGRDRDIYEGQGSKINVAESNGGMGLITKGEMMDKLVEMWQDPSKIKYINAGLGDDSIYKRFDAQLDLDRFGEQTIDVADFEIEVSDDTFPSQFKLEFYYKEEPEMGGPGQNEVKFVWDPKDYNNSDIQFSGNQKKATVSNFSFTTGKKNQMAMSNYGGQMMQSFVGKIGIKIIDYFDNGEAKTLSDSNVSKDKGEYRQIKIRFGDIMQLSTNALVEYINSQEPAFNIISNNNAFTLLKADHSSVSWGNTSSFAPQTEVSNNNIVYDQNDIERNSLLKPVKFEEGLKTKDGGMSAIIKSNGSIISWPTQLQEDAPASVAGSPSLFSNSHIYTELEKGENPAVITKLVSTNKAFCAINSNGEMACWGENIGDFPGEDGEYTHKNEAGTDAIVVKKDTTNNWNKLESNNDLFFAQNRANMQISVWGDMDVRSEGQGGDPKYYYDENDQPLPKKINYIVGQHNMDNHSFLAAPHSLAYITVDPESLELLVTQELKEDDFPALTSDLSGNEWHHSPEEEWKLTQTDGMGAFDVDEVVFPTLPESYWILDEIKSTPFPSAISGANPANDIYKDNICRISPTFSYNNKQKYNTFKDSDTNDPHTDIPTFFAPMDKLAVKFNEIAEASSGSVSNEWPKTIVKIMEVKWNTDNTLLETTDEMWVGPWDTSNVKNKRIMVTYGNSRTADPGQGTNQYINSWDYNNNKWSYLNKIGLSNTDASSPNGNIIFGPRDAGQGGEEQENPVRFPERDDDNMTDYQKLNYYFYFEHNYQHQNTGGEYNEPWGKKRSFVVYYKNNLDIEKYFMITFYVEEMFIPSYGRIFIGKHKKRYDISIPAENNKVVDFEKWETKNLQWRGQSFGNLNLTDRGYFEEGESYDGTQTLDWINTKAGVYKAFDLTMTWNITLDGSLHYANDYEVDESEDEGYMKREGKARVYFFGYWPLLEESINNWVWDYNISSTNEVNKPYSRKYGPAAGEYGNTFNGELRLDYWRYRRDSSNEYRYLPSYLFPDNCSILLKGNKVNTKDKYAILKNIKLVWGSNQWDGNTMSFRRQVTESEWIDHGPPNGDHVTFEGGDSIFNYDHIFKFKFKKSSSVTFDYTKDFVDGGAQTILDHGQTEITTWLGWYPTYTASHRNVRHMFDHDSKAVLEGSYGNPQYDPQNTGQGGGQKLKCWGNSDTDGGAWSDAHFTRMGTYLTNSYPNGAGYTNNHFDVSDVDRILFAETAYNIGGIYVAQAKNGMIISWGNIENRSASQMMSWNETVDNTTGMTFGNDYDMGFYSRTDNGASEAGAGYDTWDIMIPPKDGLGLAGNVTKGGVSVYQDLSNPKIFKSSGSFAALVNGWVYCFGSMNHGAKWIDIMGRTGGDTRTQLGGANKQKQHPVEIGSVKGEKVFSTERAFAVIRSGAFDGTIMVWGHPEWGGMYQGRNYFYYYSGTAVVKDGVEDDWWIDNGWAEGWNSTWAIKSLIDKNDLDFSPVVDIKSTRKSFAALREDKSVISWGNNAYGGNKEKITDVEILESNLNGFTVIKTNGEIENWGLMDSNNKNFGEFMGGDDDGEEGGGMNDGMNGGMNDGMNGGMNDGMNDGPQDNDGSAQYGSN